MQNGTTKLFGLRKGSKRFIFVASDPLASPKVLVRSDGSTRRMPIKQARVEFRRLLDDGFQRCEVCECCEDADLTVRQRPFGDHDHPMLCDACHIVCIEEEVARAERKAGWDATP